MAPAEPGHALDEGARSVRSSALILPGQFVRFDAGTLPRSCNAGRLMSTQVVSRNSPKTARDHDISLFALVTELREPCIRSDAPTLITDYGFRNVIMSSTSTRAISSIAWYSR
jgi:hypothetical protein